MDKQLQIESLERDREATLNLLNEAQKQSYSPKPANERSQLLEEARRRQKERALLTDFKPVQQTWDGWEDHEPVFDNKEKESQSSSKLPLKKDADDFKQFIDKEYLQLKQELENLRKCSKPVESLKPAINTSSAGSLNEAPVKSAEKVVRTAASVKRTVEKPKVQPKPKPQPFIEVKFKEKPTREKEENVVVENTQRKNSFRVESSCIEILPEGRKSPLPLTKREVEKKSEKIEGLEKNAFQGNILSSSKNSSGRASSVYMNERQMDTRTQRTTWAETPQPGINWDNRYPVFQPFNYPYYQYPPMPGYGYSMPYGPPSYPPSYPGAYPPPPPPQNYHPNYAPTYYQPPAEVHFPQQYEERPTIEKPAQRHYEYQYEKEEFEAKDQPVEDQEKEALFDYEEVVKPFEKPTKKPSPDSDKQSSERTLETQTPETHAKRPENKPEPFFITFNPIEKPEKFVTKTIENKKPVLIEIGVKNTKSLADNFKEKNNSLAARIHKREDKLPKQDHKEKTKEELIEIRKNFVKVPKTEGKGNLIEIKIEEKKNAKEPSSELMERLATGQRARISKEEMLKLNKKNYQQLPEVKRRQEEQKKRQEKQQRLQKAKEYEKVRIDKSRYKYVMDN